MSEIYHANDAAIDGELSFLLECDKMKSITSAHDARRLFPPRKRRGAFLASGADDPDARAAYETKIRHGTRAFRWPAFTIWSKSMRATRSPMTKKAMRIKRSARRPPRENYSPCCQKRRARNSIVFGQEFDEMEHDRVAPCQRGRPHPAVFEQSCYIWPHLAARRRQKITGIKAHGARVGSAARSEGLHVRRNRRRRFPAAGWRKAEAFCNDPKKEDTTAAGIGSRAAAID